MEGQPFSYSDERLWSDERIVELFHEKREHLEKNAVHLSDERRVQLNREITNLAFEGLQREQLKKKRQEEVAWLEHSFELPEQPNPSWVLDE